MVKEYRKSNSSEKQNTDKKHKTKKKNKLSSHTARRNLRKKLSKKSGKKTKSSRTKTQKNEFKKIKLKALNKFYIQPEKNINEMNINELKEFADQFDLNPEINYKLLSYLKQNNPSSYKKYISKYKYTLDFKDALELKCFDEKEIIEVLDEFNQNLIKKKLNVQLIDTIENINSLSKLKIFNLLYFLLFREINDKNFEEIENSILSYSIPQTLIFKVPNKFANTELLYYFYLVNLINILVPEKFQDNNPKNVQDLISSFNKGIFFNFRKSKKIVEKKVNLKSFFSRKKSLEEYIEGYETSSETIEKVNKENISTTNKNEYKAGKMSFLSKCKIINKFSDIINDMLTLTDEKEVIQRIKFIIYSLIFFKNDPNKLNPLIECLKNNNYSKGNEHSNEI